jgi:hypothetical protein
MSGRPGAGGCLALVGFLVVEIAAGFGVGYLAYLLLAPAFRAVIPAREVDFANVCAVCLAFLPAGYVVFALDRLCKRLVGHSAMDQLPDWTP